MSRVPGFSIRQCSERDWATFQVFPACKRTKDEGFALERNIEMAHKYGVVLPVKVLLI